MDLITKRLNSGDTREILKSQELFMQERLGNYLKSPPSVLTQKVIHKRTYHYDPTYRVLKDIKDSKGHVMIPAGHKVNPLETHVLRQGLLFIDGSDAPQVSYALKSDPKTKIILTNGSPIGLMKQMNRTIYYDYYGHLIQKLGIKAVPASVTQKGLRLQIEEIVVGVDQ